MKKEFVITIVLGLILSILLGGVRIQSLDEQQEATYDLKIAQHKQLWKIELTQDEVLVLNEKATNQYLLEKQSRIYNISISSGQYLVLLEVGQYLGEKSTLDLKLQIALDKQFSNIISSTDSYGSKGDERCILNVSSPCDIYIKVASVSGYGSCSILISDDINEGYIPLYLDKEQQGGVDEEDYRVYYITNLTEGEYIISVQPKLLLDLELTISFDPLFVVNETIDESGYGAAEKINVKINENQVLYIRIFGKSGSSSFEIRVSMVTDPFDFAILIPIIAILSILTTLLLVISNKNVIIYFYNQFFLPYIEKREETEEEASEIIDSDQEFPLLLRPKAIFPEELPSQQIIPFNDTVSENISSSNVSESVITFSLKDDVKTCAICRKSILETEKSKKCSVCKTPFHFDHFVQWVRRNGFCPECHEKIVLEREIDNQDLTQDLDEDI